MRTILVVEDNVEINKILSSSLEAEGYNVLSAFNAFEALTFFSKNEVDCIITDLVLPIMSGEEFIQNIRKKSNVHIMIISAKITIQEKLNGLRIGADDYFSKPFNEEEVIIKIHNYFKKIDHKKTRTSINDGLLIFENMNNTILVDRHEVDLTSIEYLILEFLIKNLNRVVTRSECVDYLYRNEKNVYERVVDSHIKNIRKKMEPYAKQELIKTVYGLGYSLRGTKDE